MEHSEDNLWSQTMSISSTNWCASHVKLVMNEVVGLVQNGATMIDLI